MSEQKQADEPIERDYWTGRPLPKLKTFEETSDEFEETSDEFEAVATGPTTADGKQIVYVAAPALEQVEALQKEQRLNRVHKRWEAEVGARMHALTHAVSISRSGPFDKEPTTEDRDAEIVASAERFTKFLLG